MYRSGWPPIGMMSLNRKIYKKDLWGCLNYKDRLGLYFPWRKGGWGVPLEVFKITRVLMRWIATSASYCQGNFQIWIQIHLAPDPMRSNHLDQPITQSLAKGFAKAHVHSIYHIPWSTCWVITSKKLIQILETGFPKNKAMLTFLTQFLPFQVKKNPVPWDLFQ